MKDKVSELRQILNQKKAAEEKVASASIQEPFDESDVGAPREASANESDIGAYDDTPLQKKCAELEQANQIQKDLYIRKAAEFENFKKRLQREHDEFSKYALEKIIQELLPVVDSLETGLTHLTNPNDAVASGIEMALKNFLQVLEKYGVKQISGENAPFDPHTQEAVATEKREGVSLGQVLTVHRKGYLLNGKVIRAAMVVVSE